MRDTVSDKPYRFCVYTTLIGQYEHLNEQPVAHESSIPFLCLTDDRDLQSESWQIRHLSPLFSMDSVRSQRDLKLRPHVHLSEFDASMYIDNSVLLNTVPEKLLDICTLATGFCLPQHSFRESVLDEFLEVARLGFDDHSRIFEQLNHYLLDDAQVLQEKPYWTGIMVRDHRNRAVCKMLDIWSAHVNRYSKRDQLSVNVALNLSSLVPEVIMIDNHVSWLHSWPHAEGRNRQKVADTATRSLIPQAGRLRELESALVNQEKLSAKSMADLEKHYLQKIADMEKQYEQQIADLDRQRHREVSEQLQRLEILTSSRSWLFASALSRLSSRCPYLSATIGRGLSLLSLTLPQQLLRRLGWRKDPSQPTSQSRQFS